MSALEVDIVDSSGTPILGQFGPLITAQFWDDSDELDSTGESSFDAPRADPKTDIIAERQSLRCSTLRGGVWTAIARGVVDTLTEDIQADQTTLLEIGGNGPLIALADRTVGSLVLTDNAHSHNENPMLAAALLPAIMAYAPAGWTVVGTPSEDVYLAFSGETVLATLGKLAKQLGDHYRYEYDATLGNILHWLPKSTPPVVSGIRAMGNIPNPTAMDSTTCLITRFSRKRDTSKRATRIWAYGGGNEKARIVLQGATYTLPAGYSYDSETISGTTRYCIKHDVYDAAGRIDAEYTFDDISAIDTTTGHALSAKNALAQAATIWLQRHVEIYYSYDVEVAGLTQSVLPGQTVRLVYDQFVPRRIPMVDADLLVLGVKKRIDADNSPRLVTLTLANSDRWPEDDDSLVTGSVVRAQSQMAHQQVAARAQIADAVTDANVALLSTTAEQALTVTDAATNALSKILILRHLTTGTAANGLGISIPFEVEDDSGTAVVVGSLRALLATAAHATYKGRIIIMIGDAGSTSREILRGESDGSNPLIGFLGAAATDRADAYTQTYNTAARIVPAYTTDTENVAYTGIATGVGGTPYAQLTDINALRVAYENMRVSYEAVMKVVNSLIDDAQEKGLAG